MKDSIKEGDTVHVDINNAQMTLCSRAKVLYIPCATGDSWIFEDLDNGNIHYVSEGCTVTKVPRKFEDSTKVEVVEEK